MEQRVGPMGVDPAVAAAVTLAEAEMLRAEAVRALGADYVDSGSALLRDLSPLGRSRS